MTEGTDAMAETSLNVTRNEDASRYELHEDDALVGYAEFEQGKGRARFIHTVIDPAYRGRGMGEVLASDALADVAQRGDKIVPVCPFIVRYLTSHDVAGAVVDWPDADGAQDAATPGESPA